MWTQAPHRCRNSLLAALWFAISLSLTPVTGSAAEPVVRAEPPQGLAAKPRIGRIFFSPTERRSRLTSRSDATSTAPARTRVAPRTRLYVNGALSSSTQRSAVWINGAAVDNSAGNDSAWADRNGNIWLTSGNHRARLVRAGQSVDRSGAIEDLLPAGSVTRR